jgi:ribosomal protein L35
VHKQQQQQQRWQQQRQQQPQERLTRPVASALIRRLKDISACMTTYHIMKRRGADYAAHMLANRSTKNQSRSLVANTRARQHCANPKSSSRHGHIRSTIHVSQQNTLHQPHTYLQLLQLGPRSLASPACCAAAVSTASSAQNIWLCGNTHTRQYYSTPQHH